MILGLDIGRQYIKAVVLDKTKSGHKLVNHGLRLVPEPNQTFDPEKISQPHWVMAVRELMKEMKINPKRVKNLVTSLNGSHVSVKQITTMDMPTEELHSSMTFEARKHIPMDGSDAVIDFQIFGSNHKEVDKIDVALVACTKKTSSAHIEILKEIGFKPGIVDVDPIAVMNSFSYSNDLPEDGAVVLLDIGTVSSALTVWGRKDAFFTRDLPIGIHEFVKSLSEKLDKDYVSSNDELLKGGVKSFNADEEIESTNEIGIAERNVFDNFVEDIRRSLRYYAKTTNQSFFTHLYLTGGGSATEGLAELIQNKLSLEVSIFNPMNSFEGYNKDEIVNPAQYTVATGLALRGGGFDA
jgi:type IV pilus assembly protein PilM